MCDLFYLFNSREELDIAVVFIADEFQGLDIGQQADFFRDGPWSRPSAIRLPGSG